MVEKEGRDKLIEATDQELIRDFVNGNEPAFERLIQRYSGYVASMAYNIMQDMHLANDISQEVFVKLHSKLRHLNDTSKFKSWLFRIVRSTCLDALRKVRFKTSSIHQFSEETVDLPDDGSKEPAASVESEELKEKVLSIISSLPKIHQQIIILKHLRNMTYREMADFLGIPSATVESRLYRARMMLKDKLENLYWEGL